ncbi:radical SAM protein [Candidatus Woesearchaeota archaeon]|nr:radical SAM protein [Candidatus Woesearchaeota archaeon]
MKRTFSPIIYDCNDNCISCPVSRRKNRINPNFDDVKEEIDEILQHSSHIEFNGGEPTLRKDLLKVLKYTESKNPTEISLLTNVQAFCYRKYTEKIAKIKNLKIITTLYGHNSKIHDAITRTPMSFKHKITGIKNLIKYNIPIELRILLHKMNYKYFNKIAEFIINNFNKNAFNKIVIMNPRLTAQAEKYKKAVAEKLTKISTVLNTPIQKLIKKGHNVEIYHFPHCVLPKSLWKYSRGVTSNKIEVVFTKECKNCLKKQTCSKIWKSYLDIFGSKEFKPIK